MRVINELKIYQLTFFQFFFMYDNKDVKDRIRELILNYKSFMRSDIFYKHYDFTIFYKFVPN